MAMLQEFINDFLDEIRAAKLELRSQGYTKEEVEERTNNLEILEDFDPTYETYFDLQ